MATLFPILQFLDPNYTQYARPLALGTVTTYIAGTSTPLVTYTDSTEAVQHDNPIVLNSNGQPEVGGIVKGIWLNTSNLYKVVIKNAAGTTLQTLDNITGVGATLSFFSTLNASLDTNGYSLLTTTGNKDIPITPTGTGQTKITNLQPQTDVDMNGYNLKMDTATGLSDDSGNEYIKFVKTGTAVNELSVSNQATGANPQIAATGGDSNIGIDLLSKGTGAINVKGNSTQSGNLRIFEDTDNGTNYIGFKSGASIASSFDLELPTAVPSLDNSFIGFTTAGVGSFLTPYGVYLGQLNSGNTWASTSLLTGYKAYRLVAGGAYPSAGLGTITNYSAGSGSNTYIGIQFYLNGAYVTSGYKTIYNGANDAGASVIALSGTTSAFILADTTSGGAYPYIDALDIVVSYNATGQQVYVRGFVRCNQLAGVLTNLNLHGGALGTFNLGALTGAKLIVGSNNLTSSLGYISVYGIPGV